MSAAHRCRCLRRAYCECAGCALPNGTCRLLAARVRLRSVPCQVPAPQQARVLACSARAGPRTAPACWNSLPAALCRAPQERAQRTVLQQAAPPARHSPSPPAPVARSAQTLTPAASPQNCKPLAAGRAAGARAHASSAGATAGRDAAPGAHAGGAAGAASSRAVASSQLPAGASGGGGGACHASGGTARGASTSCGRGSSPPRVAAPVASTGDLLHACGPEDSDTSIWGDTATFNSQDSAGQCGGGHGSCGQGSGSGGEALLVPLTDDVRAVLARPSDPTAFAVLTVRTTEGQAAGWPGMCCMPAGGRFCLCQRTDPRVRLGPLQRPFQRMHPFTMPAPDA